MGKHETVGISDEWYTPQYIFDALDVAFDMDVAAPVDRKHSVVQANEFLTSNSLDLEWKGFVWMNPPFGNMKNKFFWLEKFFAHGNGIALTPDRTSAPWWQYAADFCEALLFVSGKIKFVNSDGTIGKQPGNGTTLFAVGKDGTAALRRAANNGLGILFVK